MEAVDVRGRFVWHQLMTRDVTGAKKFYSKLVGWRASPWPLDPSYTVCHCDAGPVAGFMEIPADLPAEVPAHWLLYIGTRDVDSVAEAAVRSGGSIVKPPSDMQGAGRYAVLKDPQGALFAIIDPENARPEISGAPPMGAFSWHELATSDNEAALAFYSGLFGWDAMERMDMGPTGIYLVFGANGVPRGGMYIKPPDNPGPPSWLPYATVSSADEGYKLALATGAKGTVPPMEVPGGSRIANVLDPSGAAFAVLSLPASGPMAASAGKPKAAAKVKAKTKAKVRPKAKAKAAPARRRSATKPKAAKKVVRKAAKRKSAPRKKSKARKLKTVRKKK